MRSFRIAFFTLLPSTDMSQSWVQGVAQAIADQIEGKYREHDGKARVEHKMWCGEDLVAFRSQHGSPFRCGRLRAKADKGKRSRVENGRCNPKCALDDQRCQRVRQDPAKQDAHV